MPRARITIDEGLTGTALVQWNGSISIGGAFSADGSERKLLVVWLPASRFLNEVRLDFDGELSAAVEQGDWTFSAPGTAIPPAVISMLPDRTNPYRWQAAPNDPIQAFALALGAIPQADRVLQIEIDDGTPNQPLDIPTLAPLSATANQQFSYEFPHATGGIYPVEYRLIGVPRGMEFDAATRTLSGLPPDRRIGSNTLIYQGVDVAGEVAEGQVSLIIVGDPRSLFRIEIDWDGDGLFANDESDITERVFDLPTMKRGRDFAQGFFGRSGAGLIHLRAWDEDHLYDRFDRNSALFGKVVPGRGVRVSVIEEGEYRLEWSGLLDEVRPQELSGRRYVRLRALGAMSLLQRRTIDVALRQDISTADAAQEVLTRAAIPLAYHGSMAGDVVMPYWLVTQQGALAAMLGIEEVELGFLYETRAGQVALASHTARPRGGTPHLVFAGPDVQPSSDEQTLLSLQWEDPVRDILSRVVIPLRSYEADAASTRLWTLLSPVLIPAGETVEVLARVRTSLGVGGVVAIEEWENPSDLDAFNSASDIGESRSGDVSIVLRPSGLSAALAISNSGASDLYVTRLTLSGRALRVSGEFDSEYANPAALAAYGDREYRVGTSFVPPVRAPTHAEQLFLAFSRAATRGTLSFIREQGTAIPDLSSLVAVRSASGQRLYYVEQIVHTWRRGASHDVRLTISEVDVLPDAAAPSVTIAAVPDGLAGSVVTLSAAVVGGAYDGDLSYTWTVSGGALDDTTAVAPRWTRPASGGIFTIALTVRVAGAGILTADGSTAMRTATMQATVIVLPDAAAPSVTIDSVPDGPESTTTRLSATLVGGAYDGAVTRAWTVSAGTLDDTAVASPQWTRPTVTMDTDVTISLTVSVAGADVSAKRGTSDSATAMLVSTVLNQEITTDTDVVYRLASARPATPTGGAAAEEHTPTGWARQAPAATFTQDVWKSERERTYTNGVFTSAGAWGTPSIHRGRLSETFGPWTGWTEVAGSRETTWGPYAATSTYRGSCASRERLWRRSGTETWTEERTREGTAGTVQRQTRGQSRGVSGEEYRAAPTSGVWTGWTEVQGSRETTRSDYAPSGAYRGSLGSREQRWDRTVSATWTEERTNPCEPRQTRPGASSTTESVWRADPVPEVYGAWTGTAAAAPARLTASGTSTPSGNFGGHYITVNFSQSSADRTQARCQNLGGAILIGTRTVTHGVNRLGFDGLDGLSARATYRFSVRAGNDWTESRTSNYGNRQTRTQTSWSAWSNSVLGTTPSNFGLRPR